MRRRRAYIAGPRDKGKYEEAERFLVTMDFLVVNPMKYEEDFSPRDIREKEYVDDVCLTGLQL